MTEQKLIKIRIHGSDTDLLNEVRFHPDLPSRSGETRLGVQDKDITIHIFMIAVDGIGTREIQGILDVEIKTRNGMPDASQQDTLWKRNWFRGQKTRKGQTVRYFGAYILRLSGTTLSNSDHIEWGRFTKDNEIKYINLTREQVIKILRLERHPNDLRQQAFRRHHHTQEILIEKMAPLGFLEYEKVIQRS